MNLSDLLKRLEIYNKDGFIDFEKNDWKKQSSFPSRILRLLENIERFSPKGLFCLDNKPLILFFENPDKKNELHKILWNSNEYPIVIILEDDTVSIYNGFSFDEDAKLLQKLSGNDYILNDFSYFKLVTGETFEKYEKEFEYHNRVDYKLLKNIEVIQNELLTSYGCSRKVANALLGKIIFIRYLIDRKVKLNFNNISKIWTNDDFCKLLESKQSVFSFFKYLSDKERGFNGDLFPINEEEFLIIPDDVFKLLRKLLEGEDIKTGQKSLFQLYDFSILPVEFISNVYERFIGKENQAKSGAYYTPTFLVDYMISQTIEKKLQKNDDVVSCKVLDPACGSGIFLVETLRKIIDKYLERCGREDCEEKFKGTLKKLTKDNIFGIDKDESAVQVAIFSIYLTLLDYQDPPEIETFKFPNLLGSNFFVADFFDTEAEYNSILKNENLDFIIGNPPWASGTNGLNFIGKKYIKQRYEREKKLNKEFEIGINNNEIAEGFIFRAGDYSTANTQIAFIIKSSILYNLGYRKSSPFRPYWLQNFYIQQVFELAPVRKEVFNRSSDPAVAPAAIVFYQYANGDDTDKNIIKHISLKPSRFFSMFKIFMLSRSDYQLIQQNKLKKYDWIWKTLVYGSYLDFNFLKHLKSDYPTIKEIVSDTTKIVEGTGIQYSNNPKYSSDYLKGKAFIDVYGVESFFINADKITVFDKSKIHRIRTEKSDIFKAPMLLIRMGLDMDNLLVKSAISKQDLLFKNSITSISVLKEEDCKYLYNIQATFFSMLTSYYAINSFAFIGIEREQTQNYDKYSLPYLELDVQKNIEEIENIKLKLHKQKNEILDNSVYELEQYLQKCLFKLNEKVLAKLKLSDCEKSLIDYAITVNKPIILNNKIEKQAIFSSIPKDDRILLDYAQLYINRFSSSLSSENKKFIVEVWHSNQIIGMFFKSIDKKDYEEDIVIKNKQNDSDIIPFLLKLSVENITKELFVLKDIRGFEKDYFYIFKPNEKRLWHKAIAYLDMNDFADTMLRSGGE